MPDKAFGVDLRPACRDHDEAYGTPGAYKQVADENLGRDVERLCKAGGISNKVCEALGTTYKSGVQTTTAQKAFDTAQKNIR